MAFREWLADTLPGLAAGRLNDMTRLPGAERAMKHWRPDIRGYDTTWFYEGTVQAVVWGCIRAWLLDNAPETALLLNEQPYPWMPDRDRVDLAILANGEYWYFVEIKADFHRGRAEEDIEELEVARAQLQDRFRFGLMLYAIWNEQAAIDRWQADLDVKMVQRDVGRAKPLIRR